MITIDWNAVTDEAAALLSDYIKINTTNPPGNEREAALFLKDILQKEGIDVRIYEPVPGRANLLAILPGETRYPPMVLLNHMDVVPVEQEKWDVDPFGGVVQDGYIYGRGSIDMKGTAVAELMALLLLARTGVTLQRPVVFLATADEETGGAYGVKWMMDHERHLKEVGFVLNEGGNIIVNDTGDVSHYEISTAQKVVCQFALKARGPAGHGSMPLQNGSNVKLVRALHNLVEWETPFIIIPLVREYFASLGSTTSGDSRQGHPDIAAALTDHSFARQFTANPHYNALVRNTLTPTILKAGHKVNVIPSDAEATFDCRLLPGTPCTDFLEELRSRLRETGAEVIPIGDSIEETAVPSPTDHECYQAICRMAEHYHPGCVVTPTLITGATDSRFFRNAGIPCYDFSPFRLTRDDLLLIHGHNERLSLDNLAFGVRFMFEMVARLAATPAQPYL